MKRCGMEVEIPGRLSHESGLFAAFKQKDRNSSPEQKFNRNPALTAPNLLLKIIN
jgi:hypothetical protein